MMYTKTVSLSLLLGLAGLSQAAPMPWDDLGPVATVTSGLQAMLSDITMRLATPATSMPVIAGVSTSWADSSGASSLAGIAVETAALPTVTVVPVAISSIAKDTALTASGSTTSFAAPASLASGIIPNPEPRPEIASIVPLFSMPVLSMPDISTNLYISSVISDIGNAVSSAAQRASDIQSAASNAAHRASDVQSAASNAAHGAITPASAYAIKATHSPSTVKNTEAIPVPSSTQKIKGIPVPSSTFATKVTPVPKVSPISTIPSIPTIQELDFGHGGSKPEPTAPGGQQNEKPTPHDQNKGTQAGQVDDESSHKGHHGGGCAAKRAFEDGGGCSSPDSFGSHGGDDGGSFCIWLLCFGF